MSKIKFYIIIILLLNFTFATNVFASFTFSADTISNTVTSFIDAGSSNFLSLQPNGGRVGIGTNAPVKKLHVSDGGETPNPVLIPGGVVAVLNGISGTQAGSIEGVAASSSIAHMPGLYLRSIRARGTLASPLSVQNGDLLSLWESEGFDGSTRAPAANIGTFVESFDGSVTGSKVSGFINFLTTPLAGNAGPVERVRIASTGNVGIGTMTPGAKLDINSNSFILETAQTPASSSANCTTGMIAWDASFFYICVATNTWHRSAHATW